MVEMFVQFSLLVFSFLIYFFGVKGGGKYVYILF